MVGLRKNEKGVSLIALVITIIVVIILAAIAFNSSTSTIGRANYSKFVTNISEVQSAIRQKMVTVKGMMNANGTQVTDGQVYNYVAKGGTSESDILVESKVPDYTVIKKTADIGIKLPSMKVNTPTKTGAEVKYGVTDDGIVFIWPPFPHEEKYYINENETVDASVISDSGELEIKVAEKTIKIEANENGELETKEIIYEGLTRKEFEKITSKVKVGDYVNYVPTAMQNIETDPTKTGYDKEVLSTDTTAKWRILSADNETGKFLITTDGYVNKVTLKGITAYFNGVNELHRLCEKLYSNLSNGIIARSITLEDLNKACNYTPMTESEKLRYAWYPGDTQESDLEDIILDGKKYEARKHTTELINLKYPTFFNWDDENGVTHKSLNKNDYKNLTNENMPILVTSTMDWYSIKGVVGDILKGNDLDRGWVASEYVRLHINDDFAIYGLRMVSSEKLSTDNVASSAGAEHEVFGGLHPIIQLAANSLDVSNTSTDGSSALKAWNIK